MSDRIVSELEPPEVQIVGELESQEDRIVGELEPQEDRIVGELEPQEDRIVGELEPQEDGVGVTDTIRKKWELEQSKLKAKLVIEDAPVLKEIVEQIENPKLSKKEFYIGGVDISFIKGDNVNACAALVVVNFPDLEVVYEDYQMVELTAPYIAGFLAFREAEFLVDLVIKLKQNQPNYLPHVVLVDGNGILHVTGFGLASHLGVLLNLPCIGVAKTLYQVDGLEKNADHTHMIRERLLKGGDTFPLVGDSGKIYGVALRSHDSSTNPIYISPGHMVCLESSIKVVVTCCRYRIPEPVRQADINSREYLRVLLPDKTNTVQKGKKEKQKKDSEASNKDFDSDKYVLSGIGTTSKYHKDKP